LWWPASGSFPVAGVRAAAYIAARENGKTPDEAVKDATLHIEGARERGPA
jgi:hypothetical protein